MTFQTDLLADSSIFFNTDEFGLAAVYQPRGSVTTVALTVVLEQIASGSDEKLSRGEGYYPQQGRLWLQVADVAAPLAGDTVAVDGVTWVVQDILGGNQLAWELAVYTAAFAGKIK